MKEKIIVALDGLGKTKSLELANQLKGMVWGFKVNDLLVECDLEIIRELKPYGNVFADPKLHDIPNTVGNSIKKLADAGASLITVHASGGKDMLEEAVRCAPFAHILAVTVLTSLRDQDITSIYGKSAQDTVLLLTAIAAEAQCHGVVCSPQELRLLSAQPILKRLLRVTPGIRPRWYQPGAQKKDDQSRTATPKEAIDDGADFLVIGRPITSHINPLTAVEQILRELN